MIAVEILAAQDIFQIISLALVIVTTVVMGAQAREKEKPKRSVIGSSFKMQLQSVADEALPLTLTMGA